VIRKSRKYELPDFLARTLDQATYEKWLRRRANAHVRRDGNRANKGPVAEDYRLEIHKAVRNLGGFDYYTGEELNWSLISKYNNADAKAGGRAYKRRFAYLPSVDHVGGPCDLDFRICAWQTNDSKNDLTYREFVALCRKVIAHYEHNRAEGAE